VEFLRKCRTRGRSCRGWLVRLNSAFVDSGEVAEVLHFMFWRRFEVVLGGKQLICWRGRLKIGLNAVFVCE
jgi:hypothetical protein